MSAVPAPKHWLPGWWRRAAMLFAHAQPSVLTAVIAADIVDPHGNASICKVGRDPSSSLMDEGVEGLRRLGAIADGLLLRQEGCTGCTLSGTCGTCMPLVQLYRKAKAPLATYCQHRERKEDA